MHACMQHGVRSLGNTGGSDIRRYGSCPCPWVTRCLQAHPSEDEGARQGYDCSQTYETKAAVATLLFGISRYMIRESRFEDGICMCVSRAQQTRPPCPLQIAPVFACYEQFS
jgi:ribosomal protein S14